MLERYRIEPPVAHANAGLDRLVALERLQVGRRAAWELELRARDLDADEQRFSVVAHPRFELHLAGGLGEGDSLGAERDPVLLLRNDDDGVCADERHSLHAPGRRGAEDALIDLAGGVLDAENAARLEAGHGVNVRDVLAERIHVEMTLAEGELSLERLALRVEHGAATSVEPAVEVGDRVPRERAEQRQAKPGGAVVDPRELLGVPLRD